MGIEYGTELSIAGAIWIGMVFVALIGIASGLFLGFCIYYDALYRRVENAAMWAVLSGLFNILALVYLIVNVTKSPQPLRCIQCGDFLLPNSRFCQRCGRPINSPSLEQLEVYSKKRKLFFWIWISSLALVVVLSTLFVALIIGSMRFYF